MTSPTNQNRDVWQNFGRLVKARRRQSRLSQQECADRAQIDRQTWHRIEAGQPTKRETVVRVAEALRVPVADYLLASGFAVSITPANSDTERLREIWSDLLPDKRADLLAIAQALAVRQSETTHVQPQPDATPSLPLTPHTRRLKVETIDDLANELRQLEADPAQATKADLLRELIADLRARERACSSNELLPDRQPNPSDAPALHTNLTPEGKALNERNIDS